MPGGGSRGISDTQISHASRIKELQLSLLETQKVPLWTLLKLKSVFYAEQMARWWPLTCIRWPTVQMLRHRVAANVCYRVAWMMVVDVFLLFIAACDVLYLLNPARGATRASGLVYVHACHVKQACASQRRLILEPCVRVFAFEPCPLWLCAGSHAWLLTCLVV